VSRQIVINATPQEARVAVMENARLAEIFIERTREKGIAGSIYKGRVSRVLPGMQAAFVDIGLLKAAFLHASDFFPIAVEGRFAPAQFEEEDLLVSPAQAIATPAEAQDRTAELPPIEERLKKGQEILVQISKGPIGNKGARLTSNISIPGRYLVYLPLSQGIGTSRRITDEKERERLQAAVTSVGTGGGGIIIRTACEGVTKREIQADLRVLRRLWAQVTRRRDTLSTPSPLHADLDVILRTVRDLFTTDVTRIVVDNRRDYQRIVDFVETAMPRLRPRVELYDSPQAIFERYGIESQIVKALEHKVWLRSGGYIVIDYTEALTAIDVNTGRYVGDANQADTILKTNLEAARVIVEQLRLRNIGGLIIIDFIDMEDLDHRSAVLAEFERASESDRARTTILGISELGLLEMTRKRTRESLAQRLCETCPTCAGKGRVKAVAAIAYEVLRRLRREGVMNAPLQALDVTLHPMVAAFLDREEPAALREIEHELGIEVRLKNSADRPPDHYEVTAVASEPKKDGGESQP
jgi:ribonuclease G